jgi:hypothetical protein
MQEFCTLKASGTYNYHFNVKEYRTHGGVQENVYYLHIYKEERNILHTVRRMKANWIGHVLRRNCLLKPVIEGKV